MLRMLLTLLLLLPMATQASEGEFFLTAKPATCARAALPLTTPARCA